MESIHISSVQEGLLHQVTISMSLLFFFLMLWVAWSQLRLWKLRPELIASQSELRQSSIIISVFIGIGVFFIFSTEFGLDELPLTLGLALGMSMAFLSPIFAFALFLSLIIFRPWELLPPSDLVAILPRASGLLVFVVFASRVIREKKLKIFWSFECALLILFLFWTFLSALQALDSKVALDSYFEVLGKSGIIFLLIVNLVKKIEDVELLKKVLVGGLLSLSVLAILYNVLISNEDPSQRLVFVGMLGDPNDITSLAVMGLPFALWPVWRSWSKHRRTELRQKEASPHVLDWLILIVYVLSFLTLLYLAQSRGAVLATAVFIGLIFMYRLEWRRKSFVIALFAALIALPTFQIVSQRESDDLSASKTNRMIFWKTAVRMAIHHPVFGVGYGDFPNQFENYLMDEGATESGKRTAHSSWLLILAENGFMGLGLFLGLFLLCLRRAYKIRDEHPEFLFSMVSYGTAMSFLSHSYLFFPYILFALTTISSKVICDSRDSSQNI